MIILQHPLVLKDIVIIPSITKKEFDSSTQNEKIAASEIKHAIDYAIKELKEKTKKEEEK